MLAVLSAGLLGGREGASHLSVEDRVRNSRLIVVGTFRLAGGPSGKHETTSVEVQEALLGSMPTNRTLWMTYTRTIELTPHNYSQVDNPEHASPCVLFLTDVDVKQPDGTKYFTQAVGGMLLATPETLREVRKVIAGLRK